MFLLDIVPLIRLTLLTQTRDVLPVNFRNVISCLRPSLSAYSPFIYIFSNLLAFCELKGISRKTLLFIELGGIKS